MGDIVTISPRISSTRSVGLRIPTSPIRWYSSRVKSLRAAATSTIISLVRIHGDSREHGEGLLQRADARVHLHRRVEAVGVGRGVAAPAALAHDHGVEVHAEGLANAGL